MMENCHNFDLPLYVVSGGITDIIESSFNMLHYNGEIDSKEAKMCWETMGIFSN